MRAGTSNRGSRRTNMNNCKPSEERHRIAVGGRACGPACHPIARTFKRFRACGVLRASVLQIEWLPGNGTFIAFQGTLVLCIQSPQAMIPAASHHKRRVPPHLHTMGCQGQTSLPTRTARANTQRKPKARANTPMTPTAHTDTQISLTARADTRMTLTARADTQMTLTAREKTLK